MSIEITMPKLSDAMEEGTILRWLKQVGDDVRRGEVIAEVETDKADMELEAESSGVLSEIRVGEGESARVGAVLALIGEAGTTAKGDGKPAEKKAAAPEKKPESEETRQKESEPKDEPKEAHASQPAPEREAERPRVEPKAAEEAGEIDAEPKREKEGREAAPAETKKAPAPRASSLARRVAQDHGVDLGSVRGTGPEGRIVRRDVEAATGVRASQAAPAVGRVELSKIRQNIAKRMVEANREIPHFYVTAEIDMDDCLRLRDMLRRRVGEALRLTVTHLVLKGVALALQRHPRVNSRWADGAVETSAEVNLGLVVALDDGGLIIPVIHRCEERTLEQIAAEANRLAAVARQGKFSGADLKGSTFAVSNLGMLDVEEFSAVINPPHAAILAVAAVKERAVVRDGRVVAARTMRVTLSCDHRQLDGVEAGRFLETLKGILESPISLVLD